ncbi:MAG: hypothetical protein V7K92_17395 [Nostoc sp.]
MSVVIWIFVLTNDSLCNTPCGVSATCSKILIRYVANALLLTETLRERVTLVTLDDSLTLRYRFWHLPLGEDSLLLRPLGVSLAQPLQELRRQPVPYGGRETSLL